MNRTTPATKIAPPPYKVGVRELSNLLLDYSSTLMGCGVHTSRLARNVARIAESYGYETEMTVFRRHITMSILHREDDTIRRTSVRKIDHGPINFEFISRLSALSWEAYDNPMPFDELQRKYEAIVSKPRLSAWVVLLLVSLANASFCRLFGGDFVAMGIVFVATLAGFFLRQQLTLRRMNQMAVVAICSLIASLIGSIGLRYGLGTTPQTALASSVLFLIPGVPLINSIVDILEGYILAGISRAIHAGILIICIAIGLSVSLLTLGLNSL